MKPYYEIILSALFCCLFSSSIIITASASNKESDLKKNFQSCEADAHNESNHSKKLSMLKKCAAPIIEACESKYKEVKKLGNNLTKVSSNKVKDIELKKRAYKTSLDEFNRAITDGKNKIDASSDITKARDLITEYSSNCLRFSNVGDFVEWSITGKSKNKADKTYQIWIDMLPVTTEMKEEAEKAIKQCEGYYNELKEKFSNIKKPGTLEFSKKKAYEMFENRIIELQTFMNDKINIRLAEKVGDFNHKLTNYSKKCTEFKKELSNLIK